MPQIYHISSEVVEWKNDQTSVSEIFCPAFCDIYRISMAAYVQKTVEMQSHLGFAFTDFEECRGFRNSNLLPNFFLMFQISANYIADASFTAQWISLECDLNFILHFIFIFVFHVKICQKRSGKKCLHVKENISFTNTFSYMIWWQKQGKKNVNK